MLKWDHVLKNVFKIVKLIMKALLEEILATNSLNV